MEASEILQLQFKGQPNFMTPTIRGIGKLTQRFAYEISSGSMLGRKIFGVTIVGITSAGKPFSSYKLNSLFDNLSEAKDYIKTLKSKMNKKVKCV